MSMSRDDAASYLSDAFRSEIAIAGILNTDDVGGLKLPIDRALQLIGVARPDIATATVDDSDAEKFERSLDYAFLRHIINFARGRPRSISLSTPNVSKQWGDWVAELERALVRSQEEAAAFIPNLSAWGAGVIALDYIEPVSVY